MINSIQSGAQGMERASKMVNTAAANIANAAAPPNGASHGDISQDMVGLIVGHKTYDANAKVVEVAARMLDKVV